MALELDDQSRSTNDGILEWKLDERRLSLTVENRAANALGIVGIPSIIVGFTMTQDTLAGLERTLAATFGDRPELRGRSGRARISGTR